MRFPGEEVPDIVYIEQLTSALYLDKREDVDHYMEVIDSLSTEALSPADTLDFIAKAARELLSPRTPRDSPNRAVLARRRLPRQARSVIFGRHGRGPATAHWR